MTLTKINDLEAPSSAGWSQTSMEMYGVRQVLKDQAKDKRNERKDKKER